MSDPVWICVALAINLDGHSDFVAVEVQNVRANGMLATKAQFGEPPSAQSGPQQTFGQG